MSTIYKFCYGAKLRGCSWVNGTSFPTRTVGADRIRPNVTEQSDWMNDTRHCSRAYTLKVSTTWLPPGGSQETHRRWLFVNY